MSKLEVIWKPWTRNPTPLCNSLLEAQGIAEFSLALAPDPDLAEALVISPTVQTLTEDSIDSQSLSSGPLGVWGWFRARIFCCKFGDKCLQRLV